MKSLIAASTVYQSTDSFSFYIPFTRVCPAKLTGINGKGGAGGILIAGPVMLVTHNSGWPIDFTRTVSVGGRKVAVMQGVGPGPAGGGTAIAQPATMNGAEATGTGVPIILTRGLGAVGWAWPPCMQVTTQFIVNKSPGIRSPPARRY
jgi:hypothetical protein